MSKEYFYMENALRNGPHTVEEMKGRIGPLTFVWTEGMRDWQKAKDIPELASLFVAEFPPAHIPENTGQSFAARPTALPPDDSGRMLAIFISVLFSIGIVLNFFKDELYIMCFRYSRYYDSFLVAQKRSLMLSIVSLLFLLPGYVCFYILLFKGWKAIPKKYARTSPGMAVGFLFIPFFNFYWVFVAFYGWCADAGRTLKSKGAKGIHSYSAIILSILTIIGAFVGILVTVADLIGLKRDFDDNGSAARIRSYQFMEVAHWMSLITTTVQLTLLIIFSLTIAKGIKRIAALNIR